MNRLIIIDGNAILHRAFHALPPLTAPDGTLVNAVYGFTSMLLRLVTDLAPTHLAVTFDRAAPTFRKQLYAAYQVKRPKMDDGLVQQIPLVHDVLTAMHVQMYELDGFEADDIIGSLCNTYATHMDQIIIVTGDKDLLQLATDKIRIYMPTKGLSEAKLYGPNETKERLGVMPRQVPDFKALAGDSSDNYPGVPGIGPKTAADLLRTYASIENLYKHIKTKSMEISGSTKEKLMTNKDLAFLSKTLATVKNDIPLKENLAPIDKANFSTDKAMKTLQKFGFYSLIKRLRAPISGTGSGEKKKTERKKAIDAQMSLI